MTEARRGAFAVRQPFRALPVGLCCQNDAMRPITQSLKLSHVRYDVRGPILVEAERLEAQGHRILRLNIGNPAPFGFEAPERILREMILNLPTAQGYSDSKGIHSARTAVAQYYQGHNLDVSVEDVYIGNGVSEMISMVLQAFVDNGNEILVPSPDYPLGHGREIYFWSFLVALMLFTVGGVFSIYEGWHKLHNPEPLTQPWWAMFVLLFSIVAEGVSMRTCMQEADKAREGRSLWQWFRQSRQSELIVIFGENLADLLGLGAGLVAVVLTMVTGDPMWDALGTLVIGVLLIVVAVFVAVEVKALLIGQSVEPAVHRAIYSYFNGRPEVKGIFSLITMQMGSDIMVAVQAEMDFSLSGHELISQINRVEAELRTQFPDVKWVFFEPDDSD